MRCRVRPEFDRWVLGSALRRARTILWGQDELAYDPDRVAEMNDLVFIDVPEPPGRDCPDGQNWVERMYPGPNDDEIVLSREVIHEGLGIGIVGNRYAPPYVIGGLTNPLTGEPNGELRGGTWAQSLFGTNCVGFLNFAREDFQQVPVHVRGVLVDRENRPLNLRDFRETVPPGPDPCGPDPFRILVAGFRTDAGKTVCARALTRELAGRGFRVTVEKKSGTACCRDWLCCFGTSPSESLDGVPVSFRFSPESHHGRDFVDGLGVVSDVSLGVTRFVEESVRYTDAFLNWRKPDFHVIELADNIAHSSNWALLGDERFSSRLGLLVYCAHPTAEAAAHAAVFIRSALSLPGLPLVLSGPLANEDAYAMVRAEIEERFKLPVLKCADLVDGNWQPMGSALADAVLAMMERRRVAEAKRC